jgi:hypothetical protein
LRYKITIILPDHLHSDINILRAEMELVGIGDKVAAGRLELGRVGMWLGSNLGLFLMKTD